LVRETSLSCNDLIWPLFVTDGDEARTPVDSMPGVDRLSISEIVKDAKKAVELGIPAIALFPNIDAKFKNNDGTEAVNMGGLVPRTVQAIKAEVPDIGVIVDVALDPYTDHGHDGILEGGTILNDETVKVLAESALVLAKSGADIVAPSDMMDGRVGAIRLTLEDAGFTDTMILAYAAKYASGFYGPFRDAVGSNAALKGDKRTYQMDPANRAEAIREVALDIEEGADIVMVKPAMPYLDILREVKDAFELPTFAYQVSGEYAMIKAAAANGWLDENRVAMESLVSIKRAGADGILTYFAPEIAKQLGQ
jgi:porphobilinogen synthase